LPGDAGRVRTGVGASGGGYPDSADGGRGPHESSACRVASSLAARCGLARVCINGCGVTAGVAYGVWLICRRLGLLTCIIHWGVVGTLLLCWMLVAVLWWIEASARRQVPSVLYDLVSSQDPSATGWLLEAVAGRFSLDGARWSAERAWAIETLTRLLSAIRAEEMLALAAPHRRALCTIVSARTYRWARYSVISALMVRAVEAAGRSGDPVYTRAIASLARRQPRCVGEQMVVAAARKFVRDRDRRRAGHASGVGPDGKEPRN